ncbi:MAG TPA: hypothetical protein VER58_19130 [Thermoanaerobaculia bacterium]|nr:hypothetical protein [Thermoanaerobaculia bacterium]
MLKSIRVERWFSAVCAMPLTTLGFVYFEAVAAAIALGHWPVPSLNDPKDLLTWPLHAFSTILLLSSFPMPILVLALVIKNWRFLRSPTTYWVRLTLFASGYALLFVVLPRLDPGHVWEWWFD